MHVLQDIQKLLYLSAHKGTYSQTNISSVKNRIESLRESFGTAGEILHAIDDIKKYNKRHNNKTIKR